MDKERLLYLLEQYTSHKATREEEQELFVCLDQLLKITYNETIDADQGWQKLWAVIQAN